MFWIRLAPWICMIVGVLILVRRSTRSRKTALDRVLARSGAQSRWLSEAAFAVYGVLWTLVLATSFFQYKAISECIGLSVSGAFLYAFFYDRRRWHEEFCASVVARGYLMCPQCTYDLRSIGPSGRCPECGAPFAQEDLPRAWKSIFPSRVRRKLLGHDGSD